MRLLHGEGRQKGVFMPKTRNLDEEYINRLCQSARVVAIDVLALDPHPVLRVQAAAYWLRLDAEAYRIQRHRVEYRGPCLALSISASGRIRLS